MFDITRPGQLLNLESFVGDRPRGSPLGDAGGQLRAGRICRRRRYPEVRKDGEGSRSLEKYMGVSENG